MATTAWDALGMGQDVSADLAAAAARIATLEAQLRDLEGSLGSDPKLSQTRTVEGLTITAGDIGSVGSVTTLVSRTAAAAYPGGGNVSQTMLQEAHDSIRLLIDALVAAGLLT